MENARLTAKQWYALLKEKAVAEQRAQDAARQIRVKRQREAFDSAIEKGMELVIVNVRILDGRNLEDQVRKDLEDRGFAIELEEQQFLCNMYRLSERESEDRTPE